MISLGKIEAVAIDGPAGSGKSTVSRLVAGRLGYVYIDTGAMYRALTLKAMTEGICLTDAKALTRLSEDMDIELAPSSDHGRTINVFLDGRDVSDEIRSMSVSEKVKHVACIAEVRNNLVKLQRAMAASVGGAVMEGRDITTVVLPGAAHKFYVDASFQERVRRRLSEMVSKGLKVTKHQVEEDLKMRDHTDRTRQAGPLRKSDDAELVDTTEMTIEEVVCYIVSSVKGTD